MPPSESPPSDLLATTPHMRGYPPGPDDDPQIEAHAVVEVEAEPVPAVPGETPSEMAYAVHTHTCTYVLDQDGTCRWIVARQGAVPAHVKQCMGAQFVACLDLETEGGLVPDLRPGAMGLFVRVSDQGRMVLLRTAPILRVEGAGGETGRASTPPPPGLGDPALQGGTLYGKKAGIPVTETYPSFSAVRTWGAEQTVTVYPTRSTNKPRPE